MEFRHLLLSSITRRPEEFRTLSSPPREQLTPKGAGVHCSSGILSPDIVFVTIANTPTVPDTTTHSRSNGHLLVPELVAGSCPAISHWRAETLSCRASGYFRTSSATDSIGVGETLQTPKNSRDLSFRPDTRTPIAIETSHPWLSAITRPVRLAHNSK